MRRWAPAIATLLAIGCSSSALTAEQQAAVERRSRELIVRHDAIWELMGLSREARDELNALVVRMNRQMAENRARAPADHEKTFRDVKRSDTRTHEAYIADHARRFAMLGMSARTQRELLVAAEFCWHVLHDPSASLTHDQRRAAETIRATMKGLGGPPPCCDESILERARAKP